MHDKFEDFEFLARYFTYRDDSYYVTLAVTSLEAVHFRGTTLFPLTQALMLQSYFDACVFRGDQRK